MLAGGNCASRVLLMLNRRLSSKNLVSFMGYFDGSDSDGAVSVTGGVDLIIPQINHSTKIIFACLNFVTLFRRHNSWYVFICLQNALRTHTNFKTLTNIAILNCYFKKIVCIYYFFVMIMNQYTVYITMTAVLNVYNWYFINTVTQTFILYVCMYVWGKPTDFS